MTDFVFNVNLIKKNVTNYKTCIVQKHSKGHLHYIIKEQYTFVIKSQKLPL